MYTRKALLYVSVLCILCVGCTEDARYDNYHYEEQPEVAEQPSPLEIFELAYRYKMGIGVEQDTEKAAELCLEAAEMGNVDAQLIIG